MSHLEDFVERRETVQGPSAQQLTDELIMLYERALLGPEVWEGDAKTILDRLIAEASDNAYITGKDDHDFSSGRGPSSMQLYFLSQIPDFPYFLDSLNGGAGMTVTASMECLRDSRRTRKFLLAVADAVQSYQDKEEIYVLEAGCGAIPILGIYAALSSPKVNVTCLEVNPNSAQIAQKVVNAINLGDRVEVLESDATTYCPDKPIDVLVSETMGNALTREPIVEIMNNLARHVKPGGKILPDHVSVLAAAISVDDYFSDAHGYVRITDRSWYHYELDFQVVAEFRPGDNLTRISFSLPNPADASTDYLVLLTSAVDIGNHHLGVYESVICCPRPIRDSDGFIKPFRPGNKTIHVEYSPGDMETRIVSF